MQKVIDGCWQVLKLIGFILLTVVMIAWMIFWVGLPITCVFIFLGEKTATGYSLSSSQSSLVVTSLIAGIGTGVLGLMLFNYLSRLVEKVYNKLKGEV